MPEPTGSFALRLIDALNASVDAAGQDEMRGIKALTRLNSAGFDVVAREPVSRPSSSELEHG